MRAESGPTVRIIYLHQYFTTPSMVGGTRSYEMARRLVRRGHEVHMVCSDRSAGSPGWRETEEAGIHVHWAPVRYSNYMGFTRRVAAFARFAAMAGRKAARLPGDLVFATSTPLTIALPAVYAARKQSIPMVFEVRDLWPQAPIAVGSLRSRPAIAAARWLERFAYRNSQRVVALAEAMKEGVVATGYPADRVTVIPNGCDLRRFQVPEQVGQAFRDRYDWLRGRPLVVYTGALGKVNGADYLARLAAAARKHDAEVRFLVVGFGCEEGKVRRVAEKLDVLGRNFFLHAPMSKHQMPAVLSAADVATSTVIDHPHLWQNSANKLFDGLAAGRPVAVNHEGELADMIRVTGCGLVLHPTDVESSAKRLVEAIRDPQWCARARAAAARLARQQFARDTLAAALESVLLAALPGGGARLAA
jgi:glycosyltransferase involved in cell wall biosynthesis